jgi:hypothetical protein
MIIQQVVSFPIADILLAQFIEAAKNKNQEVMQKIIRDDLFIKPDQIAVLQLLERQVPNVVMQATAMAHLSYRKH